ncbi:MAG: EAL domain-containing protein, partial [Actinomycetota bacterium]
AAEFMEAMEQTGLIVPVGEWVMQEACRQATYWARTFPNNGPIPVTVNLSTRQVVQRDFVTKLHHAIDGAETEPGLVTLEVREQTLLSDPQGPWTALRAAKDLGVGLSVDNFGRGSSSIATLLTLRLDQLKIDRSYVEAMEVSSEDRAVIRHLVALAKDLGLRTVAEGITERAQVTALAELGCDQVQGHFVGKPGSAGAIDELLYRDLNPTPAVRPESPAEPPAPAGPPEGELVGAAGPVPSAGSGDLPTRSPGASGAGAEPIPPRATAPAIVPAETIKRRVNPRRADLFGR